MVSFREVEPAAPDASPARSLRTGCFLLRASWPFAFPLCFERISGMTTNPLRLDVHEAIECAHTLASRFYIDPHILVIEKEKIFRRTWQLMGTTMQPCGEVT